jgi:hypothetical protein
VDPLLVGGKEVDRRRARPRKVSSEESVDFLCPRTGRGWGLAAFEGDDLLVRKMSSTRRRLRPRWWSESGEGEVRGLDGVCGVAMRLIMRGVVEGVLMVRSSRWTVR